MGLIHLYSGDGKGKTTAAVGLAVRMSGAGKKVLFGQFFKTGGSSELRALALLPGVKVLSCDTIPGRYSRLSEEQRQQVTKDYRAYLEQLLREAPDYDLLVLDEAVSACNRGILEEAQLLDFLQTKPGDLEVVLTGREPSAALRDLADYHTEMKKHKHPYDRGVKARRGVEF